MAFEHNFLILLYGLMAVNSTACIILGFMGAEKSTRYGIADSFLSLIVLFLLVLVVVI